jgi:CxC2 like cysteine cluster associated with KDZ transposases
MMGIFAPYFDKFQQAILEREYDAAFGTLCKCGAGQANFRCHDCFDLMPSCQNCLVETHCHQPFHRVQEWVGTHYLKRDLGELGHVILLGHRGRRCPNAQKENPGRRVTIVHTNGVHSRCIVFCSCKELGSGSDAMQLMENGLFPATINLPETVFTFTVLKDFHIHSLVSKKAPYDHIYALRKLTNSVFPHEVVVSVFLFQFMPHSLNSEIERIFSISPRRSNLALSQYGSASRTSSRH